MLCHLSPQHVLYKMGGDEPPWGITGVADKGSGAMCGHTIVRAETWSLGHGGRRRGRLPAGGLAGPRLGPCDRSVADQSPGQGGGCRLGVARHTAPQLVSVCGTAGLLLMQPPPLSPGRVFTAGCFKED